MSRAGPVRSRKVALLWGVLVLLLLGPGVFPIAHAATPPPLPPATYGRFISSIDVPPVAPGASGTLSFLLSDPLNSSLTSVQVSVELYLFIPYPGNSTETLPSDAPVFANGSASGPSASWSMASLGPQAAVPLSVPVQVPAPAASGAYPARISLTFLTNGSRFTLESRGFFSTSQWSAATRQNGTINVTQLGVSGILPETAVGVWANSAPVLLDVILAASVALAAVGGFLAYRGAAASRSGARKDRRDGNRAASAFGNSRRRDGD